MTVPPGQAEGPGALAVAVRVPCSVTGSLWGSVKDFCGQRHSTFLGSRDLCFLPPCCAVPSLSVCLCNPMLVSLNSLLLPPDKKIERLDTDDLDEIEKIAN